MDLGIASMIDQIWIVCSVWLSWKYNFDRIDLVAYDLGSIAILGIIMDSLISIRVLR